MARIIYSHNTKDILDYGQIKIEIATKDNTKAADTLKKIQAFCEDIEKTIFPQEGQTTYQQ